MTLSREASSVDRAEGSKLRAVFMTTQVAMSALLLVIAGLLVRGLMNAHTINRGLVTEGVVVSSIDLESAD